ncbi:DUF1538 domain-containing protein [Zooshikella harenae]|uniref:DUF1538 domain-containing protein n=1 Tax=Zooshikella harenae TaxID=2827238 RepID=A0ABS5ZAB7_9GAMM|nr:DUF1538 domain-containing protein [Zooshikella harenae]MBU2710975.1 DUF1538 domain-containing protein [Zooshikella harenae]
MLYTGLIALVKSTLSSLRDLTPILLVVTFFQLFVLQQPLPHFWQLMGGLLCVLIGLTLFIHGLETGLFPIGETMAKALAHKGSLAWLFAFSFALGFGTTVAEPALISVCQEAAEVAAEEGIIAFNQQAQNAYAYGLRFTVALSVGIAIMVGVLRILQNWPLHLLMIAGYVIVTLITLVAPQEIIGIAYDSGGVTTSTITVPLVTALGVGLASAIKGRNPLIDGFGLIAFASLFPIIFVMIFGMVVQWLG